MATTRRSPAAAAPHPKPGTPDYFEAHYNTSLRVPEFHAIQAHWAQASVEARHRQPRMRTLAYGDQPGETLDFFRPNPPMRRCSYSCMAAIGAR
ncbi:hypothetical protein [Pigmentiphaga litoralis]|uniref:hypothetical protein n=1 Tax=Pigmentiphaga litoralis TaxID=516702 RepID=UPI003B42E377